MTSLRDKRVVVTRPRNQAEPLTRALRRAGAKPVELAVIGIDSPPNTSDLDAALTGLSSGLFDAVVFTSANAVERTFNRLETLGIHGRLRTPIVAVGPATARALARRGMQDAITPDSFTGVDAARALGAGSGRVLLPQAEEARPATAEALREQGWTVETVTAYRTVPISPDPQAAQEVRAGLFDAVTFTSGSAVRGFIRALGDPGDLGLGPGGSKAVVCLGASASDEATAAGMGVVAVAAEPTMDALAVAVAQALQ